MDHRNDLTMDSLFTTNNNEITINKLLDTMLLSKNYENNKNIFAYNYLINNDYIQYNHYCDECGIKVNILHNSLILNNYVCCDKCYNTETNNDYINKDLYNEYPQNSIHEMLLDYY